MGANMRGKKPQMYILNWDLNLEFQMLVALQVIGKFEWSCELGYWLSYVLNMMFNNGWKRAH